MTIFAFLVVSATPNLSSTTPHMLTPRSTLCVFLGFFAHHKGYRCLDLASNKVIISRHVVFDESAFPFAERSPLLLRMILIFLDSSDYVSDPIVPPLSLPAGPSGGRAGSSP